MFVFSNFLASSWIKLNKDVVCFGAKNDSYGNFTIQQGGAITTLKLVYVSGYVTCNTKNAPYGSHWACNSQFKLGTIVTDADNSAVFPHEYKNTSYLLPGYHINSSELVSVPTINFTPNSEGRRRVPNLVSRGFSRWHGERQCRPHVY